MARKLRDLWGFLGLRVWLDDFELNAGQDLSEALLSAVADCDVFVLLWSQFAAQSKWVERELHHWVQSPGRGADRTLLVLSLDGTPQPSLPDTVSGVRVGRVSLRLRALARWRMARLARELLRGTAAESMRLLQAQSRNHRVRQLVTSAIESALRLLRVPVGLPFPMRHAFVGHDCKKCFHHAYMVNPEDTGFGQRQTSDSLGFAFRRAHNEARNQRCCHPEVVEYRADYLHGATVASAKHCNAIRTGRLCAHFESERAMLGRIVSETVLLIAKSQKEAEELAVRLRKTVLFGGTPRTCSMDAASEQVSSSDVVLLVVWPAMSAQLAKSGGRDVGLLHAQSRLGFALVPLLVETVTVPDLVAEVRYVDLRNGNDERYARGTIAKVLRRRAEPHAIVGEYSAGETELSPTHPRSIEVAGKAICHECAKHRFKDDPDAGAAPGMLGIGTRSETARMLRRAFFNQACTVHGEFSYPGPNHDGECAEFVREPAS